MSNAMNEKDFYVRFDGQWMWRFDRLACKTGDRPKRKRCTARGNFVEEFMWSEAMNDTTRYSFSVWLIMIIELSMFASSLTRTWHEILMRTIFLDTITNSIKSERKWIYFWNDIVIVIIDRLHFLSQRQTYSFRIQIYTLSIQCNSEFFSPGNSFFLQFSI